MTDPIDFETEKGSPPVLLDVPGTATPLGRMAWLDKQSRSTWAFMLRVRDEDLGQPLTVHYRIVTETNVLPSFEQVSVPANGMLTRDFQILVQDSQVGVGKCQRLDVAVSGSFFEGRDSPLYFDEVMEEGDLDLGVFWLLEGKGEDIATEQEKARLLDSCNVIEEFLTPSGTTGDFSP